ncbi:MAG TPA: sporulation protein [Candidatus Limnocylindria bacterium]
MNVTEMLEGAREAMTVKRVYGEPIEREGLTIVPAANVRGGGGGGGDAENNGGGGFGLTASPVGVYVVKDGNVNWEPAVDVNRISVMGIAAGIVALLVLRSVVKTLSGR